MIYDFTDPLVRRMVDLNHQPTERLETMGAKPMVRCQECLQSWPCEPRQALRQHEEASIAETLEKLSATKHRGRS